MKRRDFLRVATPVITLPLVLGGFPIRAFGRSRALDALCKLSVALIACLSSFNLMVETMGLTH